MDAVEDLHQSAFARTVLPQKRVDFAGVDAKIHLVVRYEVSETNRDAAGLEHDRGATRGGFGSQDRHDRPLLRG